MPFSLAQAQRAYNTTVFLFGSKSLIQRLVAVCNLAPTACGEHPDRHAQGGRQAPLQGRARVVLGLINGGSTVSRLDGEGG